MRLRPTWSGPQADQAARVRALAFGLADFSLAPGHAMGVAVFFGMLGVTFFGLFLTPVFYVLLRELEKRVTGTAKVRHHVTA
jgi:hypothetical protein